MIGTLLRVGIADILPTGDDGLPWGTLIVNVAGCFVLAAMVTVWNRARLPSRAMRSLHIAVGTGLIGAFTTFSDYAVEVIELARDDLMLGSAYALGSLAAGVAAGMLGIQLGRVARRERVPA